MRVVHFIPSPELQPFIDRYVIVRSDAGFFSRLLPGPGLTVALRIAGRVVDADRQDIAPAVIAGIGRQAAVVQYTAHTANLIIRFKAGGAAAFTGENLHALFGRRLALDAVFPSADTAILEERLASADGAACVGVAEQFLRSQLRAAKPDLLVQAAIGRIGTAQGAIRIKPLADALYISQDSFEKRFRRAVGTTPKHFAAILRLQAVISGQPAAPSLTQLGHSAGYFDQAHFIRDFRSLTGLPPRAFFASRSGW